MLLCVGGESDDINNRVRDSGCSGCSGCEWSLVQLVIEIRQPFVALLPLLPFLPFLPYTRTGGQMLLRYSGNVRPPNRISCKLLQSGTRKTISATSLETRILFVIFMAAWNIFMCNFDALGDQLDGIIS